VRTLATKIMTTKSTILAILGDHRDDVRMYFDAELPSEFTPNDMDEKLMKLIEEIKELP